MKLPVPGLVWGPVIDEDIFTRPILDQLRQGDVVRVPYILGTNNDECSFVASQGFNTETDLHEAMVSSWGLNRTQADTILSHYPYTDPESVVPQVATYQLNTTIGLQYKRANTLLTDLVHKGPVRYAAQLWLGLNSKSTSPLYIYNANTTVSTGGLWYGAAHGFELPYMFYNLNGTGWEGDQSSPFHGGNPFTGRPQSYIDLATVMSGMWASFVSTGVPYYKNRESLNTSSISLSNHVNLSI